MNTAFHPGFDVDQRRGGISGSGYSMTSLPGRHDNLPHCPPLLSSPGGGGGMFDLLSYRCPLALGTLPATPAMLYHALMMTSFYRRQFCSMCSTDRSPSAVKRSASDREPPTRVSTHSSATHRHKVPIDDDECMPSDNINSFKCRRLDQESLRHSADTSRKCAGTQTSFSSFVYTPNESAPCAHVTAAPLPSNRSDHGTRENPTAIQPRLNFDLDPTNNVPLNLTVSSSGRNSGSNSPTGQSRQSPELGRSIWKPLDPVGQRMSASSGSMDGGGSWGSRSLSNLGRVELRRPESSPCLRPTEQQQRKCVSVVTVECDDDIEAHFQRSLGRDYSRHLANQHQNNSPPAAAAVLVNSEATTYLNGDRLECRNANVSVAVSVDDHFTKSLGPMWNQIKSGLAESVQTDAGVGNDSNHFTSTISSNGAEMKTISSPIPGSVDDHFAKALGDAWFKIKAEQEKV